MTKRGSLLASERGTTLLETAFAAVILLVVLVGLLSMAGVATALTENHGHLAARTAEYAQDKMEQLLSLKFGDEQSDTTLFPTVTAGGTGLAVGGSADVEAPVVGYTDYLDRDGNLLCPCGEDPPADWFYKRVWQVTAVSATLKQVTVVSIVSRAVANAYAPRSSMVALKSDPF
jgi:hypothetical protein